jgi:hypothetical protein
MEHVLYKELFSARLTYLEIIIRNVNFMLCYVISQELGLILIRLYIENTWSSAQPVLCCKKASEVNIYELKI